MREALRQRASDLATDAAVKVHSHKSAAETWAWARYGLGVPAAVLAALAGYFALGEENLGWGGLMALAAAVLSTLMTALKPGEEVTKHHQAAGRFGDIRNRAKTLATVDVESTLDEHALRTKLEALQAATGAGAPIDEVGVREAAEEPDSERRGEVSLPGENAEDAAQGRTAGARDRKVTQGLP